MESSFHQDFVFGIFDLDIFAVRQAAGEIACGNRFARCGRGRRRQISTGVMMASAEAVRHQRAIEA